MHRARIGGEAVAAFEDPFVDDRIGLPGNLVLSLATLDAALLVIRAGLAGQLRLAGAAVVGVVALTLVVRQVIPAIAGL